jgi:hypothetical protein
MYVVYCHTCLETGKSYVGLTKKSIERRWLEHVYIAFNRVPSRDHRRFCFQDAIKKHGVGAWRHETLQEGIETLDEACEAEVSWISKLNTVVPHGYNQTHGGKVTRLSDEAKERHRLATSLALQREDVKARHIAGVRAGHNTPEYLAKNTETQRIAQSRPEVAEKKRSVMKERCSNEGWQSPVSKRVKQYARDGVFLAEHESATVAARASNVNYTNLCETARGLRKSCGGFVWRYVVDETSTSDNRE